jgi:hypothetical protein
LETWSSEKSKPIYVLIENLAAVYNMPGENEPWLAFKRWKTVNMAQWDLNHPSTTFRELGLQHKGCDQGASCETEMGTQVVSATAQSALDPRDTTASPGIHSFSFQGPRREHRRHFLTLSTWMKARIFLPKRSCLSSGVCSN